MPKLPYPLDPAVVREALQTLPRQFRTKDLSTHPLIQRTYANLTSDAQYHAQFGESLQEQQGALGIKRSDPRSSTPNAWWERTIELQERDEKPASVPRAYSPRDTYDIGDRIDHPTFGRGEVIDARENKVTVRFDQGAAIDDKQLLHHPQR